MNPTRALATLDTNVAIYAFDGANPKAPVARAVLANASFVSVQLLNEFANVTVRKRGRSWADAHWGVSRIETAVPEVRAISAAETLDALRIGERYRLSFYDALMLAVALAGGAEIFYSEDMKHGLVVDGRLRIVDPFR